MQSKRDFRNTLWTLAQAERSRVLLERTRKAQARALHAKVTGYGRAVDSITDKLSVAHAR